MVFHGYCKDIHLAVFSMSPISPHIFQYISTLFPNTESNVNALFIYIYGQGFQKGPKTGQKWPPNPQNVPKTGQNDSNTPKTDQKGHEMATKTGQVAPKWPPNPQIRGLNRPNCSQNRPKWPPNTEMAPKQAKMASKQAKMAPTPIT